MTIAPLLARGGEASAEGRFTTEDLPPRLMRVDGVPNVRDIGGWRGLGGRRVPRLHA